MWENPGKTLGKSRKTPGKPGKTQGKPKENPKKPRTNPRKPAQKKPGKTVVKPWENPGQLRPFCYKLKTILSKQFLKTVCFFCLLEAATFLETCVNCFTNCVMPKMGWQ